MIQLKVKGKKDDEVVDHIDRNPCNNQKYNLRAITQQENTHNCSKQEVATSKYIGVHLSQCKKYWYMQCCINGNKSGKIRYFSEIAAAYAYNKLAYSLSEFASLNTFENLTEKELEYIISRDKIEEGSTIKIYKPKQYKKVKFNNEAKNWDIYALHNGKDSYIGSVDNEEMANKIYKIISNIINNSSITISECRNIFFQNEKTIDPKLFCDISLFENIDIPNKNKNIILIPVSKEKTFCIDNEFWNIIIGKYYNASGFIKTENKELKRIEDVLLNFDRNENINKTIVFLNKNRNDYRLENLKEIFNYELNLMVGKVINDTSSSKYKGVSFNRSRNCWVAQYEHNGKGTQIGYFSSEITAAYAYNKEIEKISELAYKNTFDEIYTEEILEKMLLKDKKRTSQKHDNNPINGVRFYKSKTSKNGSWIAGITIKQKHITLGSFKTKEEAIQVRKHADEILKENSIEETINILKHKKF